jgi:hypothetical protein
MRFLKMNLKKIIWTQHAKEKMKHYQISEARIRRILKSPERVERGIAEGTLAAMQRVGRKRIQELWVMYEDSRTQRRIISAWRYPGRTKPGELIIPEDAY